MFIRSQWYLLYYICSYGKKSLRVSKKTTTVNSL